MLHLPECTLLFEMLENSLPPYIDYHAVDHTLGVFHSALKISDDEGINPKDRKLLGIAAVYHDVGYIRISIGHEQVSCEIAAQNLSRFDYSTEDIDTICGLIMATRIPQTPTTLLQQIICDADMDYLGRSDFFLVGDRLYNELHQQGLVSDKPQWNLMQVSFLKQHRYFTKSAIERRQQQKLQNLKILESKFELS